MNETYCTYPGRRDETIVAYLYGEMDVDERAVFDRPDAAADGELDPLGAMGVRRDEHPELRRLVHGGLDHRQLELHDAGPSAPG